MKSMFRCVSTTAVRGGVCAAMLLFLAGNALAEEGKAIQGPGAGSCATWTKARKAERFPVQFAWVLGFLSAYDHYNQRNVFGSAKIEGIANRVDVYCAEKPFNTVYDASAALIEELERLSPKP